MGVDNTISRRDFLKGGVAGLGVLALWAMGVRPAGADGPPPTSTPIPVEMNIYFANDDLNKYLNEFSSTWQGSMMGAVRNSLPPNSTADLSSVFQTLIDKIVSHVGNECNNSPRKNGNHDADFTRLLLETLINQMTPEQFMNGVDEILVLNRNYTMVRTGEARWEKAVFIKHRYTNNSGKVTIGNEESWSIFNFKRAGSYGKNGDFVMSSSGTNFFTNRIPANLSESERAKLVKEMQALNSDIKNANKIYSKADGIAVIRTIKDRLKQSPLTRAASDYKPLGESLTNGPSGCNGPNPQTAPVMVDSPQTVSNLDPQVSSEFSWQPARAAAETAGFTMVIGLALLSGALAFHTRTA